MLSNNNSNFVLWRTSLQSYQYTPRVAADTSGMTPDADWPQLTQKKCGLEIENGLNVEFIDEY